MLSSGSRRLAIVAVSLFNLCGIIYILVYLDKIPADFPVVIGTSIKSLTDKFDYSYLTGYNKNNTQPSSSPLDSLGYVIEPGNVQFKFINPKNKKGNPKEILKHNEKVYADVVNKPITEPQDLDLAPLRPPEDKSNYERANATIIALVRNAEASKIGSTIKKFERSFNNKFQYPYTFINDEPFSDRFKEKMRSYSSAPMEFVTVPAELWDRPESIDVDKQDKAMAIMESHDVAYAKKLSYHNMCRFYSGTFFNLPELQKYKYYWRIEPNVDFYTDLQYDVFKYMQERKRVYGFTINLYDIDESVATLWEETLAFLNTGDNYKYVNKNGAFQWLLDDLQNPKKNKVAGGYSTCHFWSNFEIADMDFYRSEAYSEWFKHLDSTGKFYYERWGDAPVHSMGVALFADKKDVHWFQDIGYFHDPYVNCPNNPATSRCKTGEFSRWEHLADQNCMANWIDYEMTEGVY